jgi:hypothetical protein
LGQDTHGALSEAQATDTDRVPNSACKGLRPGPAHRRNRQAAPAACRLSRGCCSPLHLAPAGNRPADQTGLALRHTPIKRCSQTCRQRPRETKSGASTTCYKTLQKRCYNMTCNQKKGVYSTDRVSALQQPRGSALDRRNPPRPPPCGCRHASSGALLHPRPAGRVQGSAAAAQLNQSQRGSGHGEAKGGAAANMHARSGPACSTYTLCGGAAARQLPCSYHRLVLPPPPLFTGHSDLNGRSCARLLALLPTQSPAAASSPPLPPPRGSRVARTQGLPVKPGPAATAVSSIAKEPPALQRSPAAGRDGRGSAAESGGRRGGWALTRQCKGAERAGWWASSQSHRRERPFGCRLTHEERACLTMRACWGLAWGAAGHWPPVSRGRPAGLAPARAQAHTAGTL